MLSENQGSVVSGLNDLHQNLEDFTLSTINAANSVASSTGDVSMSASDLQTQIDNGTIAPEDAQSTAEDNGMIFYGGHVASLQGPGGVALSQSAIENLNTAVSNVANVGTAETQIRRAVQRTLGSLQ